MSRRSNYDKYPFVAAGAAEECSVGWAQIAARLSPLLERHRGLCIECYPGARVGEIREGLESHLPPALSIYESGDCLRSPSEIRQLLDPILGADRVFGRMNSVSLEDYFDPERLLEMRRDVDSQAAGGPVIVLGTGASFVAPDDAPRVYADLARWEIQLRWRGGEMGNLGLDNAQDRTETKYKYGYFAEWRAADRLKSSMLSSLDYLLDTNAAGEPKLIAGEALRRCLDAAARRPFRVVPYFDPGPWGGHWMEEVCDLPRDAPNHAWCFDCVPEENSLLLGFGERRVEIPSIDLLLLHPRMLLGEDVCSRFAGEFPIRFDLLDTMGGGNLSLQVHPLTAYIRSEFGMRYTQDESYYLLDAGAGASVFLGLREDVSPQEMVEDLVRAQEGGERFCPERYVNQLPARKHDHFLIPAGTVHCSGANCMVLEVSATPYIFTFKLWDWGRVGLDGRPRPIHIAHGASNIRWDRRADWVGRELVNRCETVAEGDGWREERTGLHELEFIETRRHWFTGAVQHDTRGGLNVLNLVEGEEVVVESPTAQFAPFVVHYAETFIVPAAVGPYTIRPHGPSIGSRCATIKASVRTPDALG